MANEDQVIGHPFFRKLVRAVAVWEQPLKQNAKRYRLNSRSYGLWLSRGEKWPTKGPKDRRAKLFMAEIAKDVDPPWPSAGPRDTEAFVYVTARNFVRAREIPNGR